MFSKYYYLRPYSTNANTSTTIANTTTTTVATNNTTTTIEIEDGTETASETGDDMEYENSGNSNEAEIEDFKEATTGDSKNVAHIFLKSKFPCNYCNGLDVYQTAVVRCPICF